MLTRALRAILAFSAVIAVSVATLAGFAERAAAQTTTIVALGLTDHKVTEEELQQRKALATPKFNTPGVAYGFVAHAKKGDTVEVHLTKDGASLMKNVRELDADDNDVLVMAGKTGVPAGGWPKGAYTAHVKVIRGGDIIAEKETDPVPFD